MQKTTLSKIDEAVARAKDFPNATIEYNFEELPQDKGITPDSFFGIKAVFNKKISPEKAVVTYKLS